MSVKNRLFIFDGQDSFLIDDAVSEWVSKHSDLSISTLDESTSMQALFDAVSHVSMFGGAQGFILKSPAFLAKPPADFDQLSQSILDQLALSDHYVIVVYYGNLDKRKKSNQQWLKAGTHQRFEPFKPWENDKVVQWVISHASGHHQLTLDRASATLLSEVSGYDLRSLSQWCQTLSVYAGDRSSLSVDDVTRCCSDPQANIFQLQDALKLRKTATIQAIVTRMMTQNTDPLSILGMILAQLRLYTQIVAFFETSSSLAALSKDIGKHEFVLKKTAPDVKRHYSINDLKKLYQLCCDADFKIKRGQIKPVTAIQELVMHF